MASPPVDKITINGIIKLEGENNLEYYILRNKEMPWGDYGDILFRGLLNVMDKNYNDLEYPEMERTGPYIPEIYIANSINIVVVDKIKTLIEKSGLIGINKFKKVIKKKIVDINWTEWDMNSETPLFYPKGKEPENYILKNEHNKKIMENMPFAWTVEIDRKYRLKKLSERIDNKYFTDIGLENKPENDIFIPENMLFIIVSERFKETMDENNINTVKYINIK